MILNDKHKGAVEKLRQYWQRMALAYGDEKARELSKSETLEDTIRFTIYQALEEKIFKPYTEVLAAFYKYCAKREEIPYQESVFSETLKTAADKENKNIQDISMDRLYEIYAENLVEWCKAQENIEST